MLIKRVTFSDSLEKFGNHGRGDRFSYNGNKVLYDYLNEISEYIGEPIELSELIEAIGEPIGLTKRVTFSDFLKEFEEYGRGGQFSYEGKRALYYYLNELSEYLGEPIELDVIGLCCEYTEYDSLEEFNEDCGYNIESLEALMYRTTVIKVDGDRFIVQNF